MAIFRVLHSTALRSLFFSPVSFADHCADWSCMAALDTSQKLGGEVRSHVIGVDLRGKIPTFVPGYDGYLMGSTLLWLLLYCCWLATNKMLRHPNLIAEVHNEVQDFFAKTFANLESHAALELTVSTGEIVCTYIYIQIMISDSRNSYVQLPVRSITETN